MNEFLTENWKWIIGTIITLIGLIVAIIQLRKKDNATNTQKSGKNSINIQSSKNIKIDKNE